ncbi:hypothetical protein DFP72DRAFT_816411 [Ephemerocybe angulata]|uniref:CCHC-type domain-containing protein n=1 Tax=Ephemerocybe angulata TaxID=980116 RepID=A0A8H6M369_9AGAR|nr:hypothetical protein DFP72DRAFT_816411 [Tulosesus angulatus]
MAGEGEDGPRTPRTPSPTPEVHPLLPGRNERRAPRWDGSPRSLEEFLEEYTELCEDLGISEARQIESLSRYAPNSDVRAMWKHLAKSIKVKGSWTRYKKLIIENTPGAGEDRRYTKADLEDLIATFKDKPMRTRTQLNEYWQRFYVIAEYLYDQGRLSTEEKSNKFLQARSTFTGPRPTGCNACAEEGHYARECPKLNEYLQKGRCKRNMDGLVCYPDGTIVTARTIHGRNMIERIDNWHKARQPSTSNVAQSNFFDVAEVHTHTTVDKYKEPQSTQKTENSSQPFAPVLTPESFAKSQNTAQNNATAPQYRYVTPIEDSKVLDDLVERSLDSSITLSTRELLAVAPEVRKVVREKITGRRVPTANGTTQNAAASNTTASTNLVESFLQSDLPRSDSGLIVAREMETIRTIEVILDGHLKTEAIVDDGSQIVSMSRKLWQKLTKPLRSDRTLTMESANQGHTHSMGLLVDLKIGIGGEEFYLQVQVMDNVAYDLLFGRPFHCLTEANFKHFSNGDCHLTLNNPNNGAAIMVPTKARVRRKPSNNLVEMAF